jgi:hypothetical protein
VLESTRYDCLWIALRKDRHVRPARALRLGLPAIPDGMAFDVEGNLDVTLPGVPRDGRLVAINQIIKVDRKGAWSVFVDDPAGHL